MTEENDRERIGRYQSLQERINILDNRRNMISHRLTEVNETLASLEDLKGQRDKDVFLPLGSGVFMKGSLKDSSNMVVLIGADTAIDMGFEKTKKTLEDNKNILKDGLKTLDTEIIKMTEELIELEPHIQQIIQRSSG